ncbi:MAG TPA: PP2C family protein-serine/threonine phosphatase [Candidatus Omnitrophota bacterium]|nr:PP2C family protein-serine/threonine phosphatase [Candidatus Omnitrophota bacterium]
MAPVVEDVRAFRLAIQKSEMRRLLLLLGVTGVMLLLMFARHFSGGKLMQGRAFLWSLMLTGIIACYAAGFLWIVNRANRSGRLLPQWFWTVGVIAESSVPTFALFCLVSLARLDPLKFVAAPAILLYGVFIAANILRLNPKLNLLFGSLAAAGHAGAIIAAVHKAGGVERSMIPFFAMYPVFLFLMGCVAAFVSKELRHHVIAALEAADLKRRTELLQGELRIAREIQQSLFPRQPLDIPGFEVIGWCKPATETGGDYYDWCKLPSEEGFVMLGDATGHGLGPALLIASCRAYVRADLPQDRDLAAFMNRLNERLSQDTDGSRYVTFVGTLIDEKTGQVKLMSAGHCPALLVKTSAGKVDQIKAHGVPLGVMPGQLYPEAQSIQLEHGDRLVVYTDGMTEAKRADGEMFGTDRLIQAAIRCSKLEGQAFISVLNQELADFLGGAGLQDDLTILSIRRL